MKLSRLIRTPYDLGNHIYDHIPVDIPVDIQALWAARNPDIIETLFYKHRDCDGICMTDLYEIESNENGSVVRQVIAKHERGYLIDFESLSSNYHQNAIDLLMKCPTEVFWGKLCGNYNPRAVAVIARKYREGKIRSTSIIFDMEEVVIKKNVFNFGALAANPSAAKFVVTELSHYLLSDNPNHRKMWIALSANPHPYAIDMLRKHWDRIDLDKLAMNPSNDAIQLLTDTEPDYRKWNWKMLSQNPAAVKLLGDYPEMIEYSHMAINPHPWAMVKFITWFKYTKDMAAFRDMLAMNYRNKYLHAYATFRFSDGKGNTPVQKKIQ